MHGETDEFFCNIIRDPVHLGDFQATLLHLFGIYHERLTYLQGLQTKLTGVKPARVVSEILASLSCRGASPAPWFSTRSRTAKSKAQVIVTVLPFAEEGRLSLDDTAERSCLHSPRDICLTSNARAC